MFNPFDLNGPLFLLFFVVVATASIAFTSAWLKKSTDDRFDISAVHSQLRDPYLIAYLRGGAKELLKIAVFNLTERKLLKVVGKVASRASDDAAGLTTNLVEKQILQECKGGEVIGDLLESPLLTLSAKSYARTLHERGLMVNDMEWQRRMPVMLIVGLGLFALAAVKIVIALSRGRHNVGFLIFLGVAALFVLMLVLRYPRTPVGNYVLQSQQAMFGHLKRRVHRLLSQGATNEAVIVAAVFGLNLLPVSAFPAAWRIFQSRPTPTTSNSSGCGSGSSCSSSSCGGGGGCGGCGS